MNKTTVQEVLESFLEREGYRWRVVQAPSPDWNDEFILRVYSEFGHTTKSCSRRIDPFLGRVTDITWVGHIRIYHREMPGESSSMRAELSLSNPNSLEFLRKELKQWLMKAT